MTDVIPIPVTINQDTLNREEVINAYLNNEIMDGKYNICRYYRRGCCLFTPESCKYAHGIEDILFNKVSYEAFLNRSKNQQATEEDSECKEQEIECDDKFIEKDRMKQPSLKLEINYKDLYNYQFVLRDKNIISEIIPQEVLNKEKSLRKQIRVLFHQDLQREYFDYFLTLYNCRSMNKAFIERCFKAIGWMAHWKEILHPTFAYEIKAKGFGNVIVRQMASEELDIFMEDSIVKIVKNNQLIEKLSISPATVTKLYYQSILKDDELLPTFSLYLKARNFGSTDEYLKHLQGRETFIEKLAHSHEKHPDEFKGLPIFTQTAQEMETLFTKIRTAFREVINTSPIGLALYSLYEAKVMQDCKQELQQFNNNIPQIKKCMTKIALEESVLHINLVSECYLFSPEKFKLANLETLNSEYLTELKEICCLSATDHIELHNLLHLRPEKLNAHIPDRQSEEFIESEMDFKKIVVVDSFETLEQAKEHLRQAKSIGIDLEGSLRINGRLELVQCGTDTKVFVFDIFGVKQLAKNDEKMAEVYNGMAYLLKEILENESICKVFHDGRKDSLALHIFLDICPANVFDLSAVHILIEQLDNYKKKLSTIQSIKNNQPNQGVKSNNSEDIKKNLAMEAKLLNSLIEEPKLPGLNDVLEIYQASHGLNGFKKIMKKRFSSVPVEYFLQRPMDKEFLVYSSKDVEDLVEVMEKMKLKLKQTLGGFVGEVDSEMIDLLCRQTSKTFAAYGCKNIDEDQ